MCGIEKRGRIDGDWARVAVCIGGWRFRGDGCAVCRGRGWRVETGFDDGHRADEEACGDGQGKFGGKEFRKHEAGGSSKGATSKHSAARKTHAAATTSHKPTPQTIRLTSAFKASEQLRPMAQQLAVTRSVAAYSGVESYARAHPGEGAAAAYLALGHAYVLDHRYSEAADTFRRAGASGTALDDYADYLGAQASVEAGKGADAYGMLDRFAERHPESIFKTNAPVLLANAHLQQNDPQGALRVLTPLVDSPQGSHADFRYALGRAYQMSGIRRMPPRCIGVCM